jgi:photosystem II stability/assembly factor-like uncharacterized protein
MAMTARAKLWKHRWILALVVVAALGLITAPRSAQAGEDAWTRFGPGDGALQSLTASPRGELYVTASFSTTEIWQLPLPTASWRWRNNGLGRPAVTALAVDPKNPSSLWSVSGAGSQSVFHSTDGGGSWARVFTGDSLLHVVHLWVVPTKKAVALLAEIGNGFPRRLLHSANGGASWTEVTGALGPVAAPPDEPSSVYAASEHGPGVVRSTDGGATFRPTGSLPVAAGDTLRALHATFGRGASVFVSFASGGLFRSTDNGRHWSRVGFVHAGPGALASEPKDPRTIYAVNGIGLYASRKNGQNSSFRSLATILRPDILEPTALAAAPGGPYFLSGFDLYRPAPGFPGYALVAKTSIETFGVAELRFHPTDPSLVAVRHYTGCVRDICDFRTFFSTDGGATFQRLFVQLTAHGVVDFVDLAFDPASTDRRLLALNLGALLIDGDTRKALLGPQAVTTVEIGADGILLAGSREGVQVSEDDGATWQTTLSNVIPISPEHPAGVARRIVDLVVNPFSTKRVIARALETTPGNPPTPETPVIYRSSDAGHTWLKLLDGSADIEFVAGAPSSLYLLESTANGTELRRSDDDGATSQLVHTFAVGDAVSDVATDPSAPLDLYAASTSGVLQSRDGGVTWEPTPGNFNPWGTYRQSIGHVQVHPTERGHLFAAPLDGGLFENQLTN